LAVKASKLLRAESLEFLWQEALMLNREYLFLQTICLKASEAWSHEGEDLCFLFLKRGVGTLLSGTLEQPLLPGDVLVLNGYSRTQPSLTAEREMIMLSFAVSFEHLFPLFASPEVSLLHNITETLQDFRYYSGFSPLAQECHRLLESVPPQFDLDHRGQLLRVVAVILTPEFKHARQQQITEHRVLSFEELTGADILTLSVTDLARRFNCSRRHLNRLFHQHFGLSVSALRMEMRLSKAVSLLRNPSSKIAEVAEQCGFNHLGLFNACFRRRFGTSPGEWCKSRPVMRVTTTPAPQSDSHLQELGRIPWLHQAPPVADAAPSNLATHPQPGAGGGKQAAPASSQKRKGRSRKPAPPSTPAVIPPHDEQGDKP
jgi:AraC-like DNA-binding protein